MMAKIAQTQVAHSLKSILENCENVFLYLNLNIGTSRWFGAPVDYSDSLFIF